MIAALQMYDWPEMRDATDGWWAGLARHLGVDLPLSRPDDFTAPWLRDDLIFGADLRLSLHPCAEGPGAARRHPAL